MNKQDILKVFKKNSSSVRSSSEAVRLQKHMDSESLSKSEAILPLLMSITSIEEKVVVEDLTKMPNLLIAWSAGMGKSTLLHNIILSLLSKKAQTDLQF